MSANAAVKKTFTFTIFHKLEDWAHSHILYYKNKIAWPVSYCLVASIHQGKKFEGENLQDTAHNA